MNELNICCVNVQGLQNNLKRRDVFDRLREKYSIICLIDTHFDKSREHLYTAEWGYKAYFSSFSSQSRGVCILFKNNFEFNIHNIYKDHDGNLLLLDIEIEKNRISFGVVYGPNKDNPSFYTNLKNSVSKMGNQHIILVGDWNMLLDPELDGKNYKNINNPNARQKVLQLITELDLYDIFRCENNEKQLYTWKRKISSGLIQMGRLDFFLISESLLSYSKKVSIHPAYRSDHNLISLSLVFNKPRKN